MNARDKIFTNIAIALDRDGPKPVREKNARARIAAHGRGPIPKRGQKTGNELIDEFVNEAVRADSEVIKLKSTNEIVENVLAIAKAIVGPDNTNICIAPNLTLSALDWGADNINATFGPASPTDNVGVSVARMAVGETGTLVLLSGPESPVSINFLPDIHIVVLFKDDILPTYEDVWDILRNNNDAGLVMPRTVNWITGPSRTADIEQSLLLGAHGPRRLVILLIDDKKT
ncbi:MAG: lactate utilization protein C [Rhodospirillaceae bacterium]|nr:lactate utilization protein C [Rhodospirillaceae bacterium]